VNIIFQAPVHKNPGRVLSFKYVFADDKNK